MFQRIILYTFFFVCQDAERKFFIWTAVNTVYSTCGVNRIMLRDAQYVCEITSGVHLERQFKLHKGKKINAYFIYKL